MCFETMVQRTEPVRTRIGFRENITCVAPFLTGIDERELDSLEILALPLQLRSSRISDESTVPKDIQTERLELWETDVLTDEVVFFHCFAPAS
jgi:hypothetical protein